MSVLQRAAIIGTGICLPTRILSNQDLEQMVETNDEWITERTGIKERRIAAAEEATVDLAERAARQALERAGVRAEDLDLIILATATPDRFVPPAACLVQHRLGAKNAFAFDLNAACSGFLYGLAVGSQFINSRSSRYILVIGAETLSRIIDWSDRNTCILFGDGAGAAVLGPAKEKEGLLSFYMRSDGSGEDLLQVPAGGSRLPASHQTVAEGLHFIKMKGNEIFKLAVRAMVSSADQALAKAGLTRADIDWVVPHQANLRIIWAMTQRLEVDRSKVVITLDHHGNTSAASIPLALAEGIERGDLKKDQIILLTGFGAGLTWGSAVLRL
jgi:3-oxoacyl-[acyl-carrier-protein] synthase-3